MKIELLPTYEKQIKRFGNFKCETCPNIIGKSEQQAEGEVMPFTKDYWRVVETEPIRILFCCNQCKVKHELS